MANRIHRPSSDEDPRPRAPAVLAISAVLLSVISAGPGYAVTGYRGSTARTPPLPAADTSCLRKVGQYTGGAVEGVVRDRQSGVPLPRVEVALTFPQADSVGPGTRPRLTETNRDGRFRFCGLAPGYTARVRAESEDDTGTLMDVWIASDSVQQILLPVESGPSGRLVGHVVSAGGDPPVTGAEVRIPSLGVAAATDEDGRFELPALPTGEYRIEVSHLSYGPYSDSVAVSERRTTVLNLALDTDPVAVEPLRVSVEQIRSRWLESNGFYDRMDDSHGTFLTREDIERRNPAQLSHLFRTVAGIEVSRNGQLGMRRAPRSLVTGRRCPIQYFINGHAVSLPTGVDALDPDEVAGIEIYKGASELPATYSEMSSVCGAVAIWLRLDQ